jgi:hypothetical protein
MRPAADRKGCIRTLNNKGWKKQRADKAQEQAKSAQTHPPQLPLLRFLACYHQLYTLPVQNETITAAFHMPGTRHNPARRSQMRIGSSAKTALRKARNDYRRHMQQCRISAFTDQQREKTV